jgi:hypothetical protein
MYKYTSELRADELGIDVKKSNSSNETPNVMTVGVENYGLRGRRPCPFHNSKVCPPAQ